MRLVHPMCASISTATAGIAGDGGLRHHRPERVCAHPTTQSGPKERSSLQASTPGHGNRPQGAHGGESQLALETADTHHGERVAGPGDQVLLHPPLGTAERYLMTPADEDVSERQRGHHVPGRPASGDQYA